MHDGMFTQSRQSVPIPCIPSSRILGDHLHSARPKALIFQKTKMMWDVQRIHGSSGKNASIIKAWFRKHVAREAGSHHFMSNLHMDSSIYFWGGHRCTHTVAIQVLKSGFHEPTLLLRPHSSSHGFVLACLGKYTMITIKGRGQPDPGERSGAAKRSALSGTGSGVHRCRTWLTGAERWECGLLGWFLMVLKWIIPPFPTFSSKMIERASLIHTFYF